MSPLRLLAVLLALSSLPACNVETAFDSDEDGWLDAQDCDPDDPGVNPDAADAWGDARDADCDGLDGEDTDGDGFAGGATGTEGAARPDCNDGDPATHPDATEWDDGMDNDCDGLIDEDGPRADDDGDGFQTSQPGSPSQCNKVVNFSQLT